MDEFTHKAYDDAVLNENLLASTEEQRKEIFKKYVEEILKKKLEEVKASEKLEDFSALTFEEFQDIAGDDIVDSIKNGFPIFESETLMELFNEFLYEYVKSKTFFGLWTGLVFAGYGKDEIYPQR